MNWCDNRYLPKERCAGEPPVELKLTDDGFLVDESHWTTEISEVLATREGIRLSPAHWEILVFVRDFRMQHGEVPPNRLFARAVAQALGPEKGNSAYLLSLFPGSPVKMACKIAGLPRPPHCF